MSEALSIDRELDFVRLDGLRRATGLPAHEWDLYVVKELVDNALDADEEPWHGDATRLPEVRVRIEYTPVPSLKSRQMLIEVSNSAVFPVTRLPDIFATTKYTSNKVFRKVPTRGALGNALKTVLGIPYVLRQRVAGEFNFSLKPMSIRAQGSEYLPRYTTVPTTGRIEFELGTKPARQGKGTVITVGVDHFGQEVPRSISDLQSLALKYHLCNPHAQFTWEVAADGHVWEKQFLEDATWASKFRGAPSILWYDPAAFEELVAALYRRTCADDLTCTLPLTAVCDYFADDCDPHDINGFLGSESLSAEDINGSVVQKIYDLLQAKARPFNSLDLGCIGSSHVRKVLAEALPTKGPILYEKITDAGDDPGIPFIIEIAVARLREGSRNFWTAINFTPTYSDPFGRRRFVAPNRPDVQVIGLSGLLESYGFGQDVPLILFLHLVCPNLEHNEFSKSEINHLPFKQILVSTLDRLFATLRQAEADEELHLQQLISEAVTTLLGELGKDERFISEQLLEKLRTRLGNDPALRDWLEKPDAMQRLASYIASFQSSSPTLTQHVASVEAGSISVPIHPDRYFSIKPTYLTQQVLAEHHASKILYVQSRELEPVVLDNNWLCRIDAALLHNTTSPEALMAALKQCIMNTKVPILILHNADESGHEIVGFMRDRLQSQQLDPERILDLGLDTDLLSEEGTPLSRLVQLMPGELLSWLLARLTSLSVPVKSIPPDADVTKDMVDRFEILLRQKLWEGAWYHLGFPRVLGEIDEQVHFTDAVRADKLRYQLKERIVLKASAESYVAALDAIMLECFSTFMSKHGSEIQEIMRAFITPSDAVTPAVSQDPRLGS
jgi:hypothetical protein